jgi:hypothetical protein
MPAPLSLRIKERYMAKRADGLSQQVAADAAGISVRSAQRIDRGELQPEGQQQQRGRQWRTRADPLAEVWESVLVPMLEKAPQLEPQTLLLHLEQIRPGEEWFRRKRTLQRRVEQWRALHGPAQEVMFLQEHRAGVLGISDFTLLKGEPITVAGEVLEHRLFHFRLPYSGWCHVAVIHGGESFIALSEALQNALALCGGVPAEHRTDSLSACFRNRDGSYAGDYTSRYRELCAHLGVIATRNNRGVAHENGAIEGPHGHWKHRLEQQLIQRGSRDFATEAEYRQLVAQVTNTLNSRYQVQGNLEIEQLHLQPLPVERFADYEPVVARVRSTSTIEVRSVTYSVPSRLIGQQLTVHLRHDRLDLFLRVRRQRKLVRRRHENWSTLWSESLRRASALPGRHHWSRWLWSWRCRPLKTWRRCGGLRQPAGAGGGLQKSSAALLRRFGSICGRVAGSPMASPAATRCLMAMASGCGSGFWPTAAMPMWCAKSWSARRGSR